MTVPGKFKSIQEIRNSIDDIDFRILKLFEERNCCVEEIIKFKKNKTEVIAKDRQIEVLALRRKWAKDLDLDPELFENFFKMVIERNIQKELEMFHQMKNC